MFTGIVKAKGRIARMQPSGGDMRLSVESDGLPFATYEPGDSISVNGVCLTAVELRDNGFDMDVSNETLRVTGLGQLSEGSIVNLEPALAVGDRMGGHLVSGHVDCVGSIVERREESRSIVLTVEIPADYARYVAKKGSICVDGTSLTVNEVSGPRFELNIIPHTAQETIIDGYRVGTKVNIEVDLLARYIERLLGKDGDGVSLDTLKEHGYA